MISFKLSSHQQQVKDVVHWFAENEMRPISLEADQIGEECRMIGCKRSISWESS